MKKFVFCISPLLAGFFLLESFSLQASALPIESQAFGHELAGGSLTVIFKDPNKNDWVLKKATIEGDPATGKGYAKIANWFEFEVIGDTYDVEWKLKNLQNLDTCKLNTIIEATFNLHGSISLFDNNVPNPGTPLSEAGRQGITMVSGPAGVGAEHDPWVTPPNKGDMYWQETINWQERVFGPDKVCIWLDDTDTIIPEPSTLVLVSVGFLGLVGYVYRKRRKCK
jgi:hypothetical protein